MYTCKASLEGGVGVAVAVYSDRADNAYIWLLGACRQIHSDWSLIDKTTAIFCDGTATVDAIHGQKVHV